MRASRLVLIWIAILLAIGLAYFEAAATQASVAGYDPFQRPDPEGTPTEVTVGIFVYDLSDISDVERTFTVDFYLLVEWDDPRLATDPAGPPRTYRRVPVNEIWTPRLLIANERELTKKYPDTVTIDTRGGVSYFQRYQGTVSFEHDLRDFPFDSNTLSIELISRGYTPQEVAFVKNVTGRGDTFSIVDWDIGRETTRAGSIYVAPRDMHFSGWYYELPARRYEAFYIWKVIVPLCLIIFMSWTVFWINPEQIGPQIGISTASMLTLILFQFNLSRFVPKISYFTRVDHFSVVSIVLVFLALVEAVMTSTLAGSGKKELSQRIDRWARVVFPALFLTNLVLAFLV